jgi:hypothetical protein
VGGGSAINAVHNSRPDTGKDSAGRYPVSAGKIQYSRSINQSINQSVSQSPCTPHRHTCDKYTVIPSVFFIESAGTHSLTKNNTHFKTEDKVENAHLLFITKSKNVVIVP